METDRKLHLRRLVLNVLRDHRPYEFSTLESYVKEIDERQSSSVPELNDHETLKEIFWDLFLERIITIDTLTTNREFPRFRLHTDGIANIEKALAEIQGL